MDRFERAGAAFAELCRTMARLRVECPWDARQTLESLESYAIEEVYEVIDAIEAHDRVAHAEELGDLLFQIVFQAEIMAHAGSFDVSDVIKGIDAKLVRRHPHVFAGVTGDGGSESWEQLKAQERPAGTSRLAGIPRHMPALLRALRTGEKAAAAGFDWPDVAGVRAKVCEEWRELNDAIAAGPDGDTAVREEIGDLFFALSSLCRHLAIDPEDALRRAIDKFHRRFVDVESQLRARGLTMAETSPAQLDRAWEQAKTRLVREP